MNFKFKTLLYFIFYFIMKINIISLNNGHSLSNDCEMICYSLKKYYKNKKLLFSYFNFQETNCSLADINIFVGVVSNFFFKYSQINIFIVDHHKFDISWRPLLPKLDYVLTKTEYSKEIMKNYISIDKIVNIGWKTLDRHDNTTEKDFNKFLLVTGQSTYRQIEKVLNLWEENYPNLTILCGKNYFNNKVIEKKEQENINYIEKYLPEEEYKKCLTEHGIHLCLGSSTTFSNSLHDCLSVKSVSISPNSLPYRDFISNNYTGYLVDNKKKKLKSNFGSEYIVKEDDLKKTIEKVIEINNKDETLLEEMGEKNKKTLREQEMLFDKNFKELFDKVLIKYKTITPKDRKYEIYNEDLPNVSIITVTYNRKHFFDLCLRNYQKSDYPRDKLEWVIIDDSEEGKGFEGLLPNNNNIRYVKLNEKKTIGEKRNIAVENCSNDIIVVMDDDDYYPPSSVKYRVACLEHLEKDVVGSCSTGILDINKIISNLTVSSFIDDYYNRIFESTLCFRKDYALKNKFEDTNIHEGISLIKDNLLNFEELSYNHIIVSLHHYNNTNNRITIKGETNGSHFNFSDELFELITSIDNKDNDSNESNKLNLNKKILKKNNSQENLQTN